jgi:hypothetical protein
MPNPNDDPSKKFSWNSLTRNKKVATFVAAAALTGVGGGLAAGAGSGNSERAVPDTSPIERTVTAEKPDTAEKPATTSTTTAVEAAPQAESQPETASTSSEHNHNNEVKVPPAVQQAEPSENEEHSDNRAEEDNTDKWTGGESGPIPGANNPDEFSGDDDKHRTGNASPTENGAATVPDAVPSPTGGVTAPNSTEAGGQATPPGMNP